MKRGFTLVELLVVLSIISILSAAGIASFVDYSRKQSLNSAVQEFTTQLQTVKSRAQSQVKPTVGTCSQNTLDGYSVSITDSQAYTSSVICSGASYPLETKTLPANITFSLDRPIFFFHSVSGGADEGTVSINGYDKEWIISVSSASVITSTENENE